MIPLKGKFINRNASVKMLFLTLFSNNLRVAGLYIYLEEQLQLLPQPGAWNWYILLLLVYDGLCGL